MAYKNTYDFLVDGGYGKPATRRLPYNDFGIFIIQDVVLGAGQQTVKTASYGANRLGFDVGEFVHINLGKADEEYVQVLAADQNAQTFDAVFTKNHRSARPCGRPSGRRRSSTRATASRSISWRSPTRTPARSHRGDSDLIADQQFLTRRLV